MSNDTPTFRWYNPDQITSLTGSHLLRTPNPVHEIFWKKEPGYLNEVVNYIKQVCVYTESDSYVIQSTSGELKRLFDTSTTSVLHRFSTTMHGIINLNWTPRKHNFSINMSMGHIVSESFDHEQFLFYSLSKLHEFYVNPPEYFRTPFSIGTDPNLGTLLLHPGNFRLLSTLYLPEDIPCCIMFKTDNKICKDYFSKIINYSCTILSMDNTILADYWNLHLYDKIFIVYSSITGMQIVEHHSELEEFKKDYEIEWTGRHFVVNDVIVASLSNGVFIPPKPLG